MRTRTLLLLAVACGLAILLAGGIQLLRVSDRPSGTDDLAVGDTGRAGDLVVVVDEVSAGEGILFVDVTLSGVVAESIDDGFRLIVPGQAVAPRRDLAERTGRTPCRDATDAATSCTLAFDTAAVEGSVRVLLLRRGEDQVRWSLSG